MVRLGDKKMCDRKHPLVYVRQTNINSALVTFNYTGWRVGGHVDLGEVASLTCVLYILLSQALKDSPLMNQITARHEQ